MAKAQTRCPTAAWSTELHGHDRRDHPSGPLQVGLDETYWRAVAGGGVVVAAVHRRGQRSSFASSRVRRPFH